MLRPDDINTKTWYYYDNQNRLIRSVTKKIK